MESSGFDDQIFNEFSTGPLSPLSAKAIQQHPHHIHHYMPNNHHHHQTIMLGNPNDMHQSQRLPDVHNILPGSSPKMDHYKNLDYGPHSGKTEYNVKIESSPYSPNTKVEYMNGNLTKLEQYSPSNDQYSPNAKIIEYSASPNNKLDYEHMQMFQHPQNLDNSNQQNILVNNINGNTNFKRKSNENLSMSGSSTPNTATTTSASPNDATSTTSANKKPSDKKKNDSNGIKKKKTR